MEAEQRRLKAWAELESPRCRGQRKEVEAAFAECVALIRKAGQ